MSIYIYKLCSHSCCLPFCVQSLVSLVGCFMLLPNQIGQDYNHAEGVSYPPLSNACPSNKREVTDRLWQTAPHSGESVLHSKSNFTRRPALCFLGSFMIYLKLQLCCPMSRDGRSFSPTFLNLANMFLWSPQCLVGLPCQPPGCCFGIWWAC